MTRHQRIIRRARGLVGPVGIALAAALAACSVARDGTDEHDLTELMRAAREGNVAETRRLVAAGARVNQAVRGHSAARELLAFLAWMQSLPKRDGGYRALHYAAAGGHAEVARLLVRAGADPDAVASRGETALSLAARRGDVLLVRLLLEAGAPARLPTAHAGRAWESPIAAAVFARNVELVHLLLDAGAGAEPDSGTGAPPLAAAAAQGDSGIAALLTARGADPNRAAGEGQTPLILAARGGHVGVVRVLLTAGADPDRRDTRAGWTAAQWAASGNHDSVVALLQRAAPGSVGALDVELVRAVQLGDASRVRQLLGGGANPNTRTSTGHGLLSVSVSRQDVEITRALLAAGAPWRVTGRGEVPLLHAAAQRGNAALVRLLLEAGAPAGESGTATYAAASGHLEVVELVQRAGADVREGADEPLRAAAIAGGVEAVRYLLGRGAVVDAHDTNGRTALSRAVAFRQHATVRVLLEAGADAGQQAPESGWTPLMSAAMAGDTAMIRLLMGAGADPAAQDREGKTAADYAGGAGNAHVTPLLTARQRTATPRR